MMNEVAVCTQGSGRSAKVAVSTTQADVARVEDLGQPFGVTVEKLAYRRRFEEFCRTRVWLGCWADVGQPAFRYNALASFAFSQLTAPSATSEQTSEPRTSLDGDMSGGGEADRVADGGANSSMPRVERDRVQLTAETQNGGVGSLEHWISSLEVLAENVGTMAMALCPPPHSEGDSTNSSAMM